MIRKLEAARALVAVAVIAAACGVAQAQSTTAQIYGRIDLGLQYTDSANGRAPKLTINSGNRTSSRLGFRVTEDLGSGLSAQAVLESGINADSGEIKDGAFFSRESSLTLNSPFGSVSLGRAGSFGAGSGSFDMIENVGAFGTSWGDASLFSTGRVSNSVIYVSPRIGGVQAGVMHSLSIFAPEAATADANAHLTSVGVNYDTKPIYAVVVYEKVNNPPGKKPKESHVLGGVRWDAGPFQLYAAYMRSKNQFNDGVGTDGPDSRQYHLGATMRVLATGQLLLGVQKLDGERDGKTENDELRLSVGYEHALSKRTALYLGITDRNGKKSLKDKNEDRKRVTAGMVHRF
jgi:predicted porin